MTTPSVPAIPELAERLRAVVDAFERAERWAYEDARTALLSELFGNRGTIISALEELSRLKAETADNGDRSGHDLPEALREFMADRGRLLAYGDADLIREAISQLSRLKAGEGWQLIETCVNRFRVLVATEAGTVHIAGVAAGQWFSADGVRIVPTHWRLLPPAPGGRS